MLVNKFFHERYIDFKASDYFCESRKRTKYVDLLSAVICFGEQLSENKQDDNIEHISISGVSIERFYEFLRDTNNDYARYIIVDDVTDSNPINAIVFCLFCLHSFSKKLHKNYIISSTLCNIFREVKPVDGCSTLLHQSLKPDGMMCLDLSRVKTTIFSNINGYIYFCEKRESVVLGFFASLNKKINSTYCSFFTTLKSDQTQFGNIYPVLPDAIVYSDKYTELDSILLNKEFHAIFNVIINSVIYINNPSKNTVIQNIIAEISGKRSKREYQLKHYTSENCVEIDLNIEKVRAYEQGKSWYKKAHTRWQRCGHGLKDVKLIFLAPQHPERKKLF